jgi:hypothetical protein
LLIAAWARRTSVLWAVLPLLAICVFEKIAFRTSHFASLLGYRLFGWFRQAFVLEAQRSAPLDPVQALAPGKFLSTPVCGSGWHSPRPCSPQRSGYAAIVNRSDSHALDSNARVRKNEYERSLPR